MLIVISPAKTLDFDTRPTTKLHSDPEFLHDSQLLIDELRALSPPRVERLMGISRELADLNFGRYLAWQTPFTPENAKQAVLAFKGDVYAGLQAETFTAKELKFAQHHLRILSGLYGVLRPLDLIQPYRLEMGTRLRSPSGANLYEFWGNKITIALNRQLKKNKSASLVNLASKEYFKAVEVRQLDADVLTPVFKDYRSGQYRIISFFAKKARGAMSAFIIKNKIVAVDDIKAFSADGYVYNKKLSSEKDFVFTRKQV